MTPAGFPHSDIHGSKPACGSPWLFAAYHVFLRRPVPWHPPCALSNLIVTSEQLVKVSFKSLSHFILRPTAKLFFATGFFTRCFPSGCAVFKVQSARNLFNCSRLRSLSIPENDTVSRRIQDQSPTGSSPDFISFTAFAAIDLE